MLGLKRETKKGYVSLLQNGKIIYEYYYTDKTARNIRIKQWQQKIKAIERKSEYQLVIQPIITEQQMQLAEKFINNKK